MSVPADVRYLVEQRRATLVVHPNGFIQAELASPLSRLHVWPDVAVMRQKTHHPIHDHRFSFESEILLGTIENIVYRVTFGLRGKYQCYLAPGPSCTTIEPFANNECSAIAETRQTFHRGDVYTLEARVFHETVWTGLAVTLVTKTANYPNIRPRVLVPAGVQPDNDFDRETANTQDALWEIVQRAVSLADRN